MSKDFSVFLHHILDAINSIEAYTKGIQEQRFYENKLIQDAVIRNLEIVGEATKKIPEAFRNKYPSIEWKKIATHRSLGISYSN